MAKDLNAFINKASKDKGLANKVNNAKSEKELRSIMANEGYELTDSDINNVSGGAFGPNVKVSTGDIDFKNFLSIVKQTVSQSKGDVKTEGDYNYVNSQQNIKF